jgi:hypothetical protein
LMSRLKLGMGKVATKTHELFALNCSTLNTKTAL